MQIISKQWQNITYIALEVCSPSVSLMENYKIVYVTYKIMYINYKNFLIFKHVAQKKKEVIWRAVLLDLFERSVVIAEI